MCLAISASVLADGLAGSSTPSLPAPPEPTPQPSNTGGEAGDVYQMTENWVGAGFLDGWDFWAHDDYTHGRVTCVSPLRGDARLSPAQLR